MMTTAISTAARWASKMPTAAAAPYSTKANSPPCANSAARVSASPWEARSAGDGIDADGLDRHEDQHRRQDQLPLARHRGQIQRHAHAQEEQAQQDASEWFDLGFQLVPEGGFGQQHPGQECAHRGGQATQLHQQGRAQHHQQRRRRHDLARGRGQQAEQRIEQPSTSRQQRQHATQRDGGLGPGIAVPARAGGRQQRPMPVAARWPSLPAAGWKRCAGPGRWRSRRARPGSA